MPGAAQLNVFILAMFFAASLAAQSVSTEVIAVRVRGGGVQPAHFPVGTTRRQLLEVLQGLIERGYGDGTVDDVEGFSVPPNDEQLAAGN